MLIPKGFAHGFLVTSEFAIINYKCDNYYDPKKESGIQYNDPKINISWPLQGNKLVLSAKDQVYPTLDERDIQNDLSYRF